MLYHLGMVGNTHYRLMSMVLYSLKKHLRIRALNGLLSGRIEFRNDHMIGLIKRGKKFIKQHELAKMWNVSPPSITQSKREIKEYL